MEEIKMNYERVKGHRLKPEELIPDMLNWIKKYFEENGDENTKAIVGISGGKDSTITAALLVRALGPDRVIGVMMPNGEQHDIQVAKNVCKHLGIAWKYFNIEDIYKSYCNALAILDPDHTEQIATNLPARIRMSILYAVAAKYHGRVANTCNLSEDYVGYSTKFGDGAGDFSLLKGLTVSEIIDIGMGLGLPEYMVKKVPEDGLSGKTDEDNLGFTYEALDKLILENEYPSMDIYEKIMKKHKASRHKEKPMPIYKHKYVYSYAF
jgi:NAD+ synthase